MRGAELAVKQRGGVVAGRKIEIIKASSNANPDVAVNAARKLVEQDKVDILVGPLSGGEGIAVKDYSKTQPQVTFINGSSGAQATTLVNPAPTSSASTPRARSGWWAWARRRWTRATSA
jgi:branched-chain amino acid transport system substrate-binding protein